MLHQFPAVEGSPACWTTARQRRGVGVQALAGGSGRMTVESFSNLDFP